MEKVTIKQAIAEHIDALVTSLMVVVGVQKLYVTHRIEVITEIYSNPSYEELERLMLEQLEEDKLKYAEASLQQKQIIRTIQRIIQKAEPFEIVPFTSLQMNTIREIEKLWKQLTDMNIGYKRKIHNMKCTECMDYYGKIIENLREPLYDPKTDTLNVASEKIKQIIEDILAMSDIMSKLIADGKNIDDRSTKNIILKMASNWLVSGTLINYHEDELMKIGEVMSIPETVYKTTVLIEFANHDLIRQKALEEVNFQEIVMAYIEILREKYQVILNLEREKLPTSVEKLDSFMKHCDVQISRFKDWEEHVHLLDCTIVKNLHAVTRLQSKHTILRRIFRQNEKTMSDIIYEGNDIIKKNYPDNELYIIILNRVREKWENLLRISQLKYKHLSEAALEYQAYEMAQKLETAFIRVNLFLDEYPGDIEKDFIEIHKKYTDLYNKMYACKPVVSFLVRIADKFLTKRIAILELACEDLIEGGSLTLENSNEDDLNIIHRRPSPMPYDVLDKRSSRIKYKYDSVTAELKNRIKTVQNSIAKNIKNAEILRGGPTGETIESVSTTPITPYNFIDERDKQFLLEWVQGITSNYENITVKDFSESWRSGLALNAIIHWFHPKMFVFESLLTKSKLANVISALDILSYNFKIPLIIDISDFDNEKPKKSLIMQFVTLLYYYFVCKKYCNELCSLPASVIAI